MKKAIWTPAAVRILDESTGGTWLAGGCALLALALKKVFGRRAELMSIRSDRYDPDRVEHVLVQIDGRYYLDGDGASAESALIKRWQRVEHVPDARVAGASDDDIWDAGLWPDDESVEELVKVLKGEVAEANPIVEGRDYSRDMALAEAGYESDDGDLTYFGYQKPDGMIVWGHPGEGEEEHSDLAHNLTGKEWSELGYGLLLRTKGWHQFRIWPDQGHVKLNGVETAAGRKRAIKLLKSLQHSHKPFRNIEIHLLHLDASGHPAKGGHGSFHHASSTGEMLRWLEQGSAESNPGPKEYWVWMRNKEGRQVQGNQTLIQPMTKALWEKYVRPLSVEQDYRTDVAKYNHRYISLFRWWIQGMNGYGEWKPGSPFLGGSLTEVRPRGKFAKRVSGFDSPEAVEWVKTADSDVFGSRLRGKTNNPGVVKRFLGGMLGKGQWVLPVDEHLERVRQALIARGLQRADRPLSPAVEAALRAQHAEAVEVYRRGGPDAIDEWVRAQTQTGSGKRRRNPIDLMGVGNLEYPEYLWAIDHGKILFYHPHGGRYEKHEDWLGSDKWKWDAKRSRLCRGRIMAITNERALYISRYPMIGSCPMDKIKAAFQRHYTQYADWPWTSDSATNPRCGNPIDLITLLGAGVIAGAVQGIVEPYVTRHVYQMDRSLAGGMHAA